MARIFVVSGFGFEAFHVHGNALAGSFPRSEHFGGEFFAVVVIIVGAGAQSGTGGKSYNGQCGVAQNLREGKCFLHVFFLISGVGLSDFWKCFGRTSGCSAPPHKFFYLG